MNRGRSSLPPTVLSKEWPTIFNHDGTLTAAVLDRLLHHADTIIIEGKSFRMQDQLESSSALT